MVALAVVALLCMSVFAGIWNYQRCMGIANSLERIGGHIVYGKDGRLLDGRPMSPKEERVARWYEAMVQKFEMAAWQPWLLLVPDPPKPNS